VAQPPLPLQEFFPAQACFSAAFFTFALFFWEPSVAQPPLPEQEFLPAHACFSCCWAVSLYAPAGLGLNDDAFKRPMVPPSKPVKAAARIREFFRLMMLHSPCV
jgi:hypothetical protein